MPSWDAEQWGWSFFEGGTVAGELASGEEWGPQTFCLAEPLVFTKYRSTSNAKTITLEEG